MGSVGVARVAATRPPSTLLGIVICVVWTLFFSPFTLVPVGLVWLLARFFAVDLPLRDVLIVACLLPVVVLRAALFCLLSLVRSATSISGHVVVHGTGLGWLFDHVLYLLPQVLRARLHPVAPLAAAPASADDDPAAQRLHVHVEGSGETPVVMLHGLAADNSYFRVGLLPLLADLRSNFRFIAPDLLGWGASKKPCGEEASEERDAADKMYSVPSQARLVASELIGKRRLMDDETGMHLVGHSFGTLVALELASQRPAAVRSLTLISPPLFRSREAAHEHFLSWLPTSVLLRWPSLVWFMCQTVCFPARHVLRNLLRLGVMTGPLSIALGCFTHTFHSANESFHALADYDGRAALRRLADAGVSIVIIHGGDDGVVPVDVSHQVAAEFENVTVHVDNEGGHGLLLSGPALAARVLRETWQ